MNRVVRAVLAWVMVIAMPEQGMAASLMLFCGPSHERMMHAAGVDVAAVRSVQAGPTLHDPADAGHAGRALHDHAAPGDRVASQPAEATGADPAGSLPGHHGKVSCSACAACCSALALPAGFTLPEAVGVAHPMQTSSPTPLASHQPDGPERPPRAGRA